VCSKLLETLGELDFGVLFCVRFCVLCAHNRERQKGSVSQIHGLSYLDFDLLVSLHCLKFYRLEQRLEFRQRYHYHYYCCLYNKWVLEQHACDLFHHHYQTVGLLLPPVVRRWVAVRVAVGFQTTRCLF
jgi:hypothetical protein